MIYASVPRPLLSNALYRCPRVLGQVQASTNGSSSTMCPHVSRNCVSTSHQKSTAFVVLLLLGLLLAYAAATPQQYVSRVATKDCVRHPDKAYGRHGKPVPDVRSSFTFVKLDAGRTPADTSVLASQGGSTPSQQQITVMSGDLNSVTAADADAADTQSSPLALCAGYSYALDVNFGGSMVNALVSSSAGKLSTDQRPGALEAVNDAAEALGLLNLYREECPNRYITPVVTRVANLVLTLPEDASGTLTIKATTASGPFDAFRTATATLPVLPRQQCETPATNPDVTTAAPSTAAPAPATPPAPATAPATPPAALPVREAGLGTAVPLVDPVSSPSATPGTFVSTPALPPAAPSSSSSSSSSSNSNTSSNTAGQATGDASAAAPGSITTTVSAPATVAPATYEELQLLSQIQAASGAADVASSTRIREQGSAASGGSQTAVVPPGRQQNAASGDQVQSLTVLILLLCALGVAVDILG